MKRWQRNTLVTVAALGAAVHRGPIIDAFTTPTAQELLAEDALQRAYGTNANVECLTQGALKFRLWPLEAGKMRKGFAFPPYHLIWLDQRYCDGLEAYEENGNKASPSDVQVEGLETLAHENAHQQRWIGDEPKVECLAVQTVEPLATALGATTVEAKIMRAQVSRLVSDQTVPGYVLPPNSCYDGGPWDIDPAHPGIFPQDPPGADDNFIGW